MITLNIKPLSVNEGYKGRRFKTDKYKAYEKEVLYTLKKMDIPEPPLMIHYEFGFSTVQSDVDNPVKFFQDLLQKKFGFNDSNVYRIIADKKVVKKGKEYIKFSIHGME